MLDKVDDILALLGIADEGSLDDLTPAQISALAYELLARATAENSRDAPPPRARARRPPDPIVESALAAEIAALESMDEYWHLANEALEQLKQTYEGLAEHIPLPNSAFFAILHARIDAVKGLKEDMPNPYKTHTIPGWTRLAFAIHELLVTGMVPELVDLYRQGVTPLVEEYRQLGTDLGSLVEVALLDGLIISDDMTSELHSGLLQDKDGTNLYGPEQWTNVNFQGRLALFWSALQSCAELTQLGPRHLYNLGYDPANDARRLEPSERAVKLLSQPNPDLDFVLPERLSAADAAKMTNEKRLRYARKHPPTKRWTKAVNSIIFDNADNVEGMLQGIRERYPSLPMPKMVAMIPVRWGTKGSFGCPTATLIAGATFDPIYDSQSNTMQSTIGPCIDILNTPIDKRQMFGKIVDFYSLFEGFFKYPFSIYIRFPTQERHLREFTEQQYLPLCAEEYLHTCLWHWSCFYNWPHAVEEHIVSRLLELNRLAHSGTPTRIEDPTLLHELDQLIDQFDDQQIPFAELATRLNRALYVGEHSKTQT